MPERFTSALKKKTVFALAGTLVAGALVAAPVIAQNAEAQSRSIALTSQISESTGLQQEQLSFYPARAKMLADRDAQAVIDESNRIIAAVHTKVDSTPLQSSVASLGEYRKLDESTVRGLTADTEVKARATAAAAAEVDRLAAEAAAAAAAAAKAAEEAAARAAAEATAQASAQAAAGNPGDARSIARSMMASQYGWGEGEFSCLDSLWERESGWNYQAYNASSGATGIPQSLPGSKMASAGADWQTNPATQISWGLSYIKGSYGTPCAAWSHSEAMNWY